MFAVLALSAQAAPPHFPLFKQCDTRWGSDEMGVPGAGPGERDTVCHQGCAMSSLSMALSGLGIQIDGQETNPGSLNRWLAANDGYACVGGDCNNLVLDAGLQLSRGHVQLIGEWGGSCCGGTAAKPSPDTIRSGLSSSSDGHLVFIAHVRNGTHFVLVTGAGVGDNFAVNDPGFSATTYAYADMSDIIVYTVFPPTLALLSKEMYPVFNQGDYRWASDLIDTETVGAVGCLMSSISAALNGHGIAINVGGVLDANPGTLNAWLKTHDGYSENDLIESAVPALSPGHIAWNESWSMHHAADLSLPAVRALLDTGTHAVIANVLKGRHFVLVVGTSATRDSTTLYVSDSGFLRNSYDLVTDVVGWRIFNMTNAASRGETEYRAPRAVLGGVYRAAGPLPST